MSERLKFQGKLYEKNIEAKRLQELLKGLVKSLRDALDPTEPVEQLDRELIVQQAGEFGMKQIELLEVMAEIRVIKRELGER
ncbi:MAG: hypothetical protein CVU57_04280 [Deltaproteobacteria bacterium HGW-Deltaproteobacteria-15]|jgi:hypothetical protein|nr:MAG: hypothetical protein CVU57_04280 [Deltaproteobacteria bacterium HGW-Deltaproteobacteria-15]